MGGGRQIIISAPVYTAFKISVLGAGRDSDSHLTPLAQYWLEHRNDAKPLLTKQQPQPQQQPQQQQPSQQQVIPQQPQQTQPPQQQQEEIDVEVVDRSQTPPPPRCPTTWTVRKADPEEIKSFREQERKRYDNPHKAFTYRLVTGF